MASQAGKRHMALALVNIDVRIGLFDSVANDLNIFDREAEMIEARLETGLALQEREAYHAVAQMTAVFVVFTFFIGHAVGDFFHAKNGLIKFCLSVPVFGHYSDVPDTCKHVSVLLLIEFFSELVVGVNRRKRQFKVRFFASGAISERSSLGNLT